MSSVYSTAVVCRADFTSAVPLAFSRRTFQQSQTSGITSQVSMSAPKNKNRPFFLRQHFRHLIKEKSNVEVLERANAGLKVSGSNATHEESRQRLGWLLIREIMDMMTSTVNTHSGSIQAISDTFTTTANSVE